MNEISDEEVINRFRGLYGGGLAQKLRDSGVPDIDAMPAWSNTKWLGVPVAKNPIDLWMYQEIIFASKPDLIIETGTNGSGSAYFFAKLFDLMEIEGHVITVDIMNYSELYVKHPKITYLTGDSLSDEIASKVKQLAAGRRIMISLDSDHTYKQVSKELELYGNLTSVGCYCVIEDTGSGASPIGDWCSRAAFEFIRDNPNFVVDKYCECHLLTSNNDGWLKRIK